MVGILLSYWGGLFSGALAVSFREGSCPLLYESRSQITRIEVFAAGLAGTFLMIYDCRDDISLVRVISNMFD